MTSTLATVEMDTDLQKWLEWYCSENDVPFSEAMNSVLEMGKQVAEYERTVPEMPKEQKLLIQCVMEIRMILGDKYLPEPEQRKIISDRAKTAIRKTLGLTEEMECQPS